MKKIPLQLLTLAVLLTAAGLGLAEGNETATLNQIGGYRQWTRVTTQPLEVKPLPISADGRLVGLPSPGD